MQAPSRGPSRTTSYASSTNTTGTQHAALVGAATAFGRPVAKSTGSRTSISGANSALAAATSVGTSPNASRLSRQAPPLSRQSTAGSARSMRSNADTEASSPGISAQTHLDLPRYPQPGRSPSPSLQAASLAAARAPKPVNTSVGMGDSSPRGGAAYRPAVGPKPRRLSTQLLQTDDGITEGPTDSTPIPPTTSLVDLFERKSSTTALGGAKPAPVIIRPTKDLAMKSPNPIRSSGGITSMFEMELDRADSSRSRSRNAIKRPSEDPSLMVNRSSGESYASATDDASKQSLIAANEKTRTLSAHDRSQSPERAGSAVSSHRGSSTQPVSIPTITAGNAMKRAPTFSASSSSARSIPAQYHQMYPARKLTQNMTGDQLANAMVAGSLASSRAPSPRKMDPPPPPSRRQKHKSHLGFSRTPSPTKTGMRHTLRKEESEDSSDDDEDGLHPYGKHKKKRLVRKHPNKHHEGDRKRWRDAVTERERKRYEGVWAANKGLHLSFTIEEQKLYRGSPASQQTKDIKVSAADQVSNIIVRDIWNRSRLPPVELELVWDLVDTTLVGRLEKEEFVVGMWLIDQRLKGRKLPVKVSETVWASVRGLQGIKIRK